MISGISAMWATAAVILVVISVVVLITILAPVLNYWRMLVELRINIRIVLLINERLSYKYTMTG
jgi:hypothetical protein